jgi:hypothetical protein
LELNHQEIWFSVFTAPQSPPVVCQKFNVTAIFAEHFELATFPWDAQDLGIKIESSIPIDTEKDHGLYGRVRLNTNHNYRSFPPSQAEFHLRDEYKISPMMYAIEDISPASRSSTGSQYPSLEICCKVRRRALFYEKSVLEPSFIFVWLSFVALLFGPSELGDRTTVTFTMLLTAAAYKMTCTDGLPKLPFETAIGQYVEGCFFLTWIVTILCCVSFILAKECSAGRENPYKYALLDNLKYDLCSLQTLPDSLSWLCFFCLNAVYLLPVDRILTFQRNDSTCLNSHQRVATFLSYFSSTSFFGSNAQQHTSQPLGGTISTGKTDHEQVHPVVDYDRWQEPEKDGADGPTIYWSCKPA